MDEAAFVSHGIGGWRAEPERSAEPLTPGQPRNAVEAGGQCVFEVGREPQLIRTNRIGLTG